MHAQAPHFPVLLEETMAALRPERGGTFVDATVGAGGHAEALLERAPAARLVGLDRDPAALEIARERLAPFGARVRLVHARFSELADVLGAGVLVDGVLADLGVSSMQLDAPARGFSLRAAGPLDMRMDPTSGPTLREVLEEIDEDALAAAIAAYGEERRASRVARALLRALADPRGIEDTAGLARVVRAAVGARRAGRIDAATRTFQALRMLVNRELDELGALLAGAPERLAAGGVLAVISFHSGEDRLVKQAMRARAAAPEKAFELVARRAVQASDEERARNPRARSARLRALRRVA
jgi:16S rRNA (cytosine1402-N4)-methyltransferase